MGTVVEIENNNGYIYRFYDSEIASATFNIQSKTLKQEMPGDDGTEPIVINLGRSQNINLDLKIMNTAVGANPLNDAGTRTISDKFDYLLGTIITSTMDDGYKVTITANHGSIVRTCMLEDISVNFQGAQGIAFLQGSIRFTTGGKFDG